MAPPPPRAGSANHLKQLTGSVVYDITGHMTLLSDPGRRAEGRGSAGVRQQTGSSQCHGGQRADGQTGPSQPAQQNRKINQNPSRSPSGILPPDSPVCLSSSGTSRPPAPLRGPVCTRVWTGCPTSCPNVRAADRKLMSPCTNEEEELSTGLGFVFYKL